MLPTLIALSSSLCLYHFSFLRLAILRVHSHGLVTIDLQCYEEDNIAQLDNVGCFKKKKTKYRILNPITHKKSHTCHVMLLTL